MKTGRWPPIILLAALIVGLSTVAWAQSTRDGLAESDRLFARAKAEWGDGKSAAAEAMLQRAREIRERLLGASDPGVGAALDELGKISYNRREYEVAESRFRAALAIAERAPGAPNVSAAFYLGDLGATLREEHHYAEAEEIVRRSLILRRSLLPPNDPGIAAGLNNLGRVLWAERRFAEAEAALDESVQIYRTALGPEHPFVKQGAALLDDLHAGLARQRDLVLTIAEWGLVLLISLAALIGCIVWSEGRAAAGVVLPVPNFVTGIVAFSRLGFIAAAAFLGSIGSTWLLVDVDPSLISDGSVRRNVGKIGGLLAVFLAFLAMQLAANAERWRRGLPRRPIVTFASKKAAGGQAATNRNATARQPAGGGVSVRRALLIGHFVVNLPVGLLLIAGWSIFIYTGNRLRSNLPLDQAWQIALFLVGILLATAPAWLWWSFSVPKWRRWALLNASDWPELKNRAIASGLIWPDGSIFGRTEFKSAARARWEVAYERYLHGAGDPPAPPP
jgi:tetratricopeptide (TPR) repeat protein